VAGDTAHRPRRRHAGHGGAARRLPQPHRAHVHGTSASSIAPEYAYVSLLNLVHSLVHQ
jgi:hypothetical protein